MTGRADVRTPLPYLEIADHLRSEPPTSADGGFVPIPDGGSREVSDCNAAVAVGRQPNPQRQAPPDRSLNHLVRAQQQRLRDRDPEGLGGFAVDREMDSRGLLNRQFARFRPF